MLRVSIRGLDPLVWRELSVPEHFTLAQLHRVLQCAFAWMDYHLHDFRVGRKRYVPEVNEMPGADTATATLASLNLKCGSRMVYAYDYGDDWEHDIEVVHVAHESVDPRGFDPEVFDLPSADHALVLTCAWGAGRLALISPVALSASGDSIIGRNATDQHGRIALE